MDRIGPEHGSVNVASGIRSGSHVYYSARSLNNGLQTVGTSNKETRIESKRIRCSVTAGPSAIMKIESSLFNDYQLPHCKAEALCQYRAILYELEHVEQRPFCREKNGPSSTKGASWLGRRRPRNAGIKAVAVVLQKRRPPQIRPGAVQLI